MTWHFRSNIRLTFFEPEPLSTKTRAEPEIYNPKCLLVSIIICYLVQRQYVTSKQNCDAYPGLLLSCYFFVYYFYRASSQQCHRAILIVSVCHAQERFFIIILSSVIQSFEFFSNTKHLGEIPTRYGALNKVRCETITIFDKYLALSRKWYKVGPQLIDGDDDDDDDSYYGTLIGSHMHSIEPWHFG